MAEHTSAQAEQTPSRPRLVTVSGEGQGPGMPRPDSPSTAKTFRFTLALLYITIGGSIAYLNGLAACNTHLLLGTNVELAAMLVVLLSVEWLEQRHYADPQSTLTNAILLAIRMALFEGMRALDCTGTALYLYPMVPYTAYFAFGANISRLLSLFYVALTLWRISRGNALWYRDPSTTSDLVAFAFVMLFMPLIAHVIQRDEESRIRTERLVADLEASQVRLRAVANQAAGLAAAEERNRLARDIHDTLGHHLTAINIQLEKALAYWQRDREQTFQAIRDAKLAAAEALQDVRRSVGALRDPDAGFSLSESLTRLVERSASEQLTIDYLLDGSETGYPTSALMALFRTVQEGLTNVQKHARATHVTLRVHLGEDEARVLLRDDGQGFDPEVSRTASDSERQTFGLRGIRERLEAVRGNFSLESHPQSGTELIATIPKRLIPHS